MQHMTCNRGDDHSLQISCLFYIYGLGGTLFEDIFTMDELLSDLTSDKAVCKAAPATPVLLNYLTMRKINIFWIDVISVYSSNLVFSNYPNVSPHC